MKTKAVMMLVMMLAGIGIANTEETLMEVNLPSTPLGSGTGLLLWNRLGSTNEVNNSEVGPNGTLNAGSFVDGPFGKAVELNMQEQMGVTFPPTIVPGPDGCIEFWAKLTGFSGTIRQPGGIWPGLVAARNQSGSDDFALFYCSNDGAANGGICARVAGLGHTGTGYFGYWTYESALKTNAVTDWHHYAIVWASQGIPGVDNGQRKAAVYVNGKLNSSYWGGGTGSQLAIPTNGLFGLLTHQGVPSGSVAFDNIKIWNHSKTNFSDRFTEDAGSLVKAKKLFLWGNNIYGQCTIPADVTNVATVATAGWHTLAIKADGTVVAWGSNNAGQCNIPSDLGTGVKAIGGGGRHSFAIKSDGTVRAWGYNVNGQCNVPAGLSGVIAVDADSFHTIALKSDGTVVVWGSNFYGEGNVPADLSNVTQISAGHCFNIVRKSDGTVAAWGQNSSGQCTMPPGLSGVKSVAAGAAHSLALKDDGTIVAWGDNSQGQCNVPAGLSNVTAIVAGWHHTVALKSDGAIVMWGNNDDNKCVVPAGLAKAVFIAAGEQFTGALVDTSLVPVTLTVSFNSQGGSPVDSKVCAENTLYGVLPIPTRDGYTFDGWFKDEAYTLPVSADMSVSTESHVLYAKWTAAPTSGSGLLLWNRLGSTNEVRNSEIGPNGTLNAGRFVDGPFGKAVELNMQEQMGVTFPPTIVPGPDGCIEFWAKLTGFSGTIRQPGGIWPGLVAARNQSGSDDFALFYCSNDGAANGGICARVAGLGHTGTGYFGYWTYESALKTNAVTDWHHYAIVWASQGIPGVDNGQRKAAVYVNGKLNSSYWGGGTGSQMAIPTNGLFGLLTHQGVPSGSVAFDNIKIWNHSKTNFSDRFNENAGDLRRFLSIVEARGEAIPGNGVQMYTYGASVNANVPATVTDGGVRYTCIGAAVDGNQFTQAGPTNVTMMLTNNATLTWLWQTEYLLQVTTNGNGFVNAAAGWHVAGNNLQLTPVPAVGWTFEGWAGETNGCVMEGSVLNVAMTQPRSISASFALATALLTFNPQGGAVTPGTKTVTFDNAYGDLPMAERPDYLFKGWWTGVNGQGTQILASSVVAIAGDHTLYANWEKIPLLCKPGVETPLTTLGGYEGFLYSEGDFDGTSTIEVRGTVTMSVSRRNESVNITAKIRVQDKSLMFKSPVLTAADPEDVSRAVMTAQGGEILDLSVGQTRFWGTLSGGSLGGEVLVVDGMRNRFADRQDVEAQAILNTFRGYYTLALPAYGALSLGEAEAAPEGSGYLTITVGNQGHVNISGVLADGTKFSKSSSLILFDGCGPEACVPLFMPLYAQKGCISGLLWFDPVKRTIVTDRDLSWFLRWEKPGSGMDGFSELLEACGGFYSSLDALSVHYRFSAGANAVPYYYMGGFASIQPVFPSDINVAADGTRLVITKGVAPLLVNGAYTYSASENASMATLSFRAATGIFSGNFKLYYDYTAQERAHHKSVTVQYSGILVPRRSEVFDDLPAGLGFYLVPDSNPALGPLRPKRSYPIELDAGR